MPNKIPTSATNGVVPRWKPDAWNGAGSDRVLRQPAAFALGEDVAPKTPQAATPDAAVLVGPIGNQQTHLV